MLSVHLSRHARNKMVRFRTKDVMQMSLPFCTTSATPPPPPPPTLPSQPLSSPSKSSTRSHNAGDFASEAELREQLHKAVLDRVPTHGWTTAAVHDALSCLGLSPASAALLPAGVASVAARFEADCNRRLAEHLNAQSESLAPTPPNPINVSNLTSTSRLSSGGTTQHKPSASQSFPGLSIRVGTRQPSEFTTHGTHEVPDESPSARAAYAMVFRLSLLDPYHQLWYQAVALRARIPRTAIRCRLLLADEVSAYAKYNAPDVSQ